MQVRTVKAQTGTKCLMSRGWSQREKNPDTAQVRVDASGISLSFSFPHSVFFCCFYCWVLNTSLTSCMTGKEVILGWLSPPCQRKNSFSCTAPACLGPHAFHLFPTAFPFFFLSSIHTDTYLLLLPYLSIYLLFLLRHPFIWDIWFWFFLILHNVRVIYNSTFSNRKKKQLKDILSLQFHWIHMHNFLSQQLEMAQGHHQPWWFWGLCLGKKNCWL